MQILSFRRRGSEAITVVVLMCACVLLETAGLESMTLPIPASSKRRLVLGRFNFDLRPVSFQYTLLIILVSLLPLRYSQIFVLYDKSVSHQYRPLFFCFHDPFESQERMCGSSRTLRVRRLVVVRAREHDDNVESIQTSHTEDE